MKAGESDFQISCSKEKAAKEVGMNPENYQAGFGSSLYDRFDFLMISFEPFLDRNRKEHILGEFLLDEGQKQGGRFSLEKFQTFLEWSHVLFILVPHAHSYRSRKDPNHTIQHSLLAWDVM